MISPQPQSKLDNLASLAILYQEAFEMIMASNARSVEAAPVGPPEITGLNPRDPCVRQSRESALATGHPVGCFRQMGRRNRQLETQREAQL